MKERNTISLERITEEPVEFAFDLSFPIRALDREPLVEISPVRFEGEVARIERGYSLEGEIAYHGMLECSRCLEPYPFREQESFTLVLSRRPASISDQEVSMSEQDLDLYYYDDPELPVEPIVEERIQIAIPMKPLCREECRGLCARCGADLNAGPCGCAVESTDPRWDALRKLTKA